MDQQPGETAKPIPDPAAHDDAWLIAFLRDRDEHCPSCQYLLRGLTSSRCPECGQWLRLGVAGVELSLTAWHFLVCSLAALAGIAMLFAAITLRGRLLFGSFDFPRGQLATAMWISLLSTIALPFAITRRKQFLLTMPHIQRFIALVTSVALAAVLILACTPRI